MFFPFNIPVIKNNEHFVFCYLAVPFWKCVLFVSITFFWNNDVSWENNYAAFGEENALGYLTAKREDSKHMEYVTKESR